MKKTITKLDNNVIKALTIACESFKQKIAGFEWLTHDADYSSFPSSLVVTCVFDKQESYLIARTKEQDNLMRKIIHNQLLKVGVILKHPQRHVRYDTEERCLAENNGDWNARLKR